MSTPSKTCSSSRHLSVLITGGIIVAGVAALVWALHSLHHTRNVDPLTESDRRINELEDSLQRLQDSFERGIA
ncbi:MAG: hypothetical protein ACYDBB_27080 [Armatimonadota bacterium]